LLSIRATLWRGRNKYRTWVQRRWVKALNVLYRFSNWQSIEELDEYTRLLFAYWKSNKILPEQRSLLLPEDGGTGRGSGRVTSL
jgi:hypothetical protein